MKEFLKIKLKTLAEESKIIRLEENKARCSANMLRAKARKMGGDGCVTSSPVKEKVGEAVFSVLMNVVDRDCYRERLHFHRVNRVRSAARSTHLAYGYLRGVPYRDMEANPREEPNWKEIERMVLQYGAQNFSKEPWIEMEPRQKQRLDDRSNAVHR